MRGDVPPATGFDIDDRLEAEVAFLSAPENYPGAVGAVEVVETHISYVFLTETHAYKLKKPVHTPALDLRTREARRRNALEELRLNRRLAPDVYLGVLPLTVGSSGLELGGGGEPVDWLVKMRRLPREGLLDELIRAGRVTMAEIDALVERLVGFYRSAPVVDVAAEEYVQWFVQRIDDTDQELTAHASLLPRAVVHDVHDRLRGFLRRDGELVGRRAAEHHVVEGHGDLRPEHVYLRDGIVVIDCLEFSRALRLVDPVDELAFLGLECERLGADDIGPRLVDGYGARCGDRPPARLVDFYAGVRAALRAKLAIWHVDDPSVRDPARWPEVATEYLRLAQDHAARLT